MFSFVLSFYFFLHLNYFAPFLISVCYLHLFMSSFQPSGSEYRICSQNVWAWIPALTITSCVFIKFLNLFGHCHSNFIEKKFQGWDKLIHFRFRPNYLAHSEHSANISSCRERVWLWNFFFYPAFKHLILSLLQPSDI